MFSAQPARRPAAALAIAAAATLWLLAIWAATLVSPRSGIAGTTASATVYLAGSLVCHQRPERSFHYNGAQLPVCARCAGLYAGAWIGAAAWAVFAVANRGRSVRTHRLIASRAPRVVLALAAAPTLVSVALGLAGIWDGTNALRASLALPFGMAVGGIVTAVAAGDLR